MLTRKFEMQIASEGQAMHTGGMHQNNDHTQAVDEATLQGLHGLHQNIDMSHGNEMAQQNAMLRQNIQMSTEEMKYSPLQLKAWIMTGQSLSLPGYQWPSHLPHVQMGAR